MSGTLGTQIAFEYFYCAASTRVCTDLAPSIRPTWVIIIDIVGIGRQLRGGRHQRGTIKTLILPRKLVLRAPRKQCVSIDDAKTIFLADHNARIIHVYHVYRGTRQ